MQQYYCRYFFWEVGGGVVDCVIDSLSRFESAMRNSNFFSSLSQYLSISENLFSPSVCHLQKFTMQIAKNLSELT